MKRFYLILSSLLLIFFLNSCENSKIKILDNGKSEYQIVVSENPSSIDSLAASELQYFINEISNIKIPILSDNESNSDKIISIGNTRQSKDICDKFYNDIKDDGFVVYTCNSNIYMIGNEGKACLYAVYHFIEKYLNCRMLSPDAIDIPSQSSIELSQINDIENPSFKYRETLYLFPNISQRYADWHRLHNRADMKKNWGFFVHSFQHLIPVKTYFEEHNEWFSEINGRRIKDGQLCLSNEELFEELCKNLASEMQKKPEANIWSVSSNDNVNCCTCQKCRELDSLYGGQTGTLIYFINKVAERFPDKTISTLAYQYSRKAPQNIKPLRNVNIMFCSIECQRQLPFVENDAEIDFRNDMKNWSNLTDNIFVWDYVVQFRNMLDPFPNLHILQANLQFFKNNNVKLMFEQGTGDNMTEMIEWRTYLIAKLLWNTDINVDSLRNDFLARYYGVADTFVAQYIDIMHKSLIESGDVLNIYGYPVNARNGYLHPDRIKEYQALFEQAYQKIGDNKILYDRLRFLELSLDFAVLDLSMNNVSEDLSFFKIVGDKKQIREDMMQKAENFLADCNRFGVKKLEEMGYPPEEFIANINNYIEKSMQKNLAYKKKVTVSTQWSNLYDVGGEQALTDGNFGSLNYSFNWLGFFGEHLDAVVDLEKEEKISQVTIDFYFYPLSWIYIPEKVEFFISNDMKSWEKIGEENYQNEENLTKAIIYKMATEDNLNKTARYIRVFAKSILTNPAWHRGYGEKSWIFADEIIVK